MNRALRWSRERPSLLFLAAISLPGATLPIAWVVSGATINLIAMAAAFGMTLAWMIPLLVFISRQARVGLSARQRTAAVAWGALAAPFLAMPAVTMWGEVATATIAGTPDTDLFAASIAAGPVEETAKLAGVALLAIAWPGRVGGARTGALAGMLVGLGFGATELLLYLGGYVGIGADALEAIGLVFLIREVLGGMYVHAALTGISGAALGWAFARRDRIGWAVAVGGLAVAASLHSLANYGVLAPPVVPWQAEDLPALALSTVLRAVPIAAVVLFVLRSRPTEPDLA